MHWSTKRALNTIATQGHLKLDNELLEALGRDEDQAARLEHRRTSRVVDHQRPRPGSSLHAADPRVLKRIVD